MDFGYTKQNIIDFITAVVDKVKVLKISKETMFKFDMPSVDITAGVTVTPIPNSPVLLFALDATCTKFFSGNSWERHWISIKDTYVVSLIPGLQLTGIDIVTNHTVKCVGSYTPVEQVLTETETKVLTFMSELFERIKTTKGSWHRRTTFKSKDEETDISAYVMLAQYKVGPTTVVIDVRTNLGVFDWNKVLFDLMSANGDWVKFTDISMASGDKVRILIDIRLPGESKTPEAPTETTEPKPYREVKEILMELVASIAKEHGYSKEQIKAILLDTHRYGLDMVLKLSPEVSDMMTEVNSEFVELTGKENTYWFLEQLYS